jgi:hypothetical protein
MPRVEFTLSSNPPKGKWRKRGPWAKPKAGWQDHRSRRKTDSPVIGVLNRQLLPKSLTAKEITPKDKQRGGLLLSKNAPKTGLRGVIVFY